MTMLTVPVYPGATVLHVGQSHTMQYIRKTDLCALNAYRNALEQKGFSLRFHQSANGNLFYTYASETDYAHLYYNPDTRTVRVISSPLGEISLPQFEREADADPQFPSAVTQSVLDYYYYDEKDPASRADGNFGACYIVTLDDGSLLVYDGGGRWGKNDVERIWGLIRERGKRNAAGRIVIAAWIITHEHVDHFFCMHHVLLRHGNELELKGLYCTPIAPELLVGRSTPGDRYIESPDALNKLRAAVGDFKLIRLHTGQVFWVRNVQLEVLCSPEDIFPEHADRYYDFNDTGIVTRMKVNGKSFLNLGDAYHVSSHVMVELWGNTLKSDYCTLAHHGWGGCTRSLYDHVQPSLVFVPFSRRWIDRILNDERYISKSSGKEKRWIQWAIDRYGDFDLITKHVFRRYAGSSFDRFLLADGCNKTLDLTSGCVKCEETFNDQPGYPYDK